MVDRKQQGKKAKRQGRAAERAVAQLIDSWGWDARHEEPDEGFDLNIEIPASDLHPACRVLVQVKSAEEMKSRLDGAWTVSVKQKRLNEYLAHRLPVFVIGVDDFCKEFRWCCIDDFSLSRSTRRGHVNKKTSSIPLPRAHTLSNTLDAKFHGEIVAAWKRRDDSHHPPAKAAAIRAELLQQKDRRLDVSLDVVNGAEVRRIYAKDEPVLLKASLTFVRPEDADALRETFRFGVPAEISAKDFEIKGSQLFDELPSSGQLSVSGHVQRRRMLLGFGRMEETSDAGAKWEIEEEADFYSGSDGFEWRMKTSSLPLRVSARFVASENCLSLSFTFDRDEWNGCDVRNLPYFGALGRLVGGALEGGSICLGWRNSGEALYLGSAPIEAQRDQFVTMSNWLRYASALKAVCSWGHIAFFWTKSIAKSDEYIRSWFRAADLIDGKVSGGNYDSVWVGDVVDASKLIGTSQSFIVRGTCAVPENDACVVKIPVLVVLKNYVVAKGDTLGNVFVTRGASSEATMQLDRGAGALPEISFPSSEA